MRSLVNQLCKCELGTPPSTKFALFRKCVEKLNKFELIDTSDREILLDLLYRIGAVSRLAL